MAIDLNEKTREIQDMLWRAGLPLTEVARLAGVSQTTLRNIREDLRPARFDSLARVHRALSDVLAKQKRGGQSG